MALTTQQQNFLSKVEAEANLALETLGRINRLEKEWFENQHNTGITDTELEAPDANGNPPPFEQINQAELTGVITALFAQRDVLNTYWGNLVRIQR